MAVVEFERDGHVAIVTLNRPEARHARSPEVGVRLADAWEAIRTDDAIRVAIITGTGSAFCAGADLGQLIPLRTGARAPENEWDERVLAESGVVSEPVTIREKRFAVTASSSRRTPSTSATSQVARWPLARSGSRRAARTRSSAKSGSCARRACGARLRAARRSSPRRFASPDRDLRSC